MHKIILFTLSGILNLTFGNLVNAQNKVMVVAHRGDWRNAPENSLNAFLLAAQMGVDIIELDLRKSKDGEIIIMHDATLNRTTNGKGNPEEYTLTELKQLRIKNGLGRISQYDPIPTLREVMLALKGKPVMVNLDKSYPYYIEAYSILTETGTLKQAIFKSEMPYDSVQLKYPQLLNKIIYMPVVNIDKPGARKVISDYLANMKPYAFEINFSSDTSAILKDNAFIRNTGAKLWINSLWASLNNGHDDDLAVEQGNKKDSWDWILACNADIIQTDRPLRMLQYLKAKKLHN